MGVKFTDGTLCNSKNVQNHLGSMHAGAQFTLAENASGEYLAQLFPDMKTCVMPLLRESSIKYKKQAHGILTAEVNVSKEDVEKFVSQFEKRGKGTIIVYVLLLDEVGESSCEGWFKWFVSRTK